ncbi:DUF5959 family protein [Streptomyces sp. DT193]|uniref:DUF5959 family protein n=1 Tax=Streptomyces sp. DT193 TaxID=3393418 RepID=UPI003CF0EE6B
MWSAGKTGTRARTARRSRKPPEGSNDPGRNPWTLDQGARQLDAEIVTSGFAQGRLDVCLTPDDLDSWSQILGEIAAGRDAVWMDDGRAPEIRFELSGRNGMAVIVVADMAASGTSVRVPVRLPCGWADEHHERLQHVRAAWPQEVVETSIGVYEWRR